MYPYSSISVRFMPPSTLAASPQKILESRSHLIQNTVVFLYNIADVRFTIVLSSADDQAVTGTISKYPGILWRKSARFGKTSLTSLRKLCNIGWKYNAGDVASMEELARSALRESPVEETNGAVCIFVDDGRGFDAVVSNHHNLVYLLPHDV